MRVRVNIPRDRDARRLTLTVVGVAGLLAAQPWLWGKVFDAAAAFRDRQTQQLQLTNVQRLTEEIRNVDPNQAALLEAAAVAFPPAAAAPQIVERLEGLAETQGLTMQLESIREITPSLRSQKLVPFDIKLTVAGPPHAILTFFDAVEHMPELTQVEQWAMESGNVPVAPGKVYRLEMTVRFWLQPTS